MSTPAFLVFLHAFLIISGEASIPHTLPFGPTRCLAVIARVPVPQPTSKTDSPGFQARQIDHVLTKGSLPAEPYHPKQKVISEGPIAGAGDCESMGISQAIERKEDGEDKLVATPNPSGRGCRNIHDY